MRNRFAGGRADDFSDDFRAKSLGAYRLRDRLRNRRSCIADTHLLCADEMVAFGIDGGGDSGVEPNVSAYTVVGVNVVAVFGVVQRGAWEAEDEIFFLRILPDALGGVVFYRNVVVN